MRTTVVIDDCEPDRYLAMRVIRRTLPKFDLVELKNGREALHFFRDELERTSSDQDDADSSAAGRSLVLLDINMPGLSGFDLLSELQKMSAENRQRLSRKYSFVMLTSSQSPTDISAASAFPMVAGFLNKPVRQAQVRELLAEMT